MTATMQAPYQQGVAYPAPSAPAKHSPLIEEEPSELAVARFLLQDHHSGGYSVDPCRLAPPVRHYLSKMNLADMTWIRLPLLAGLTESYTRMFPHHFDARELRMHQEYPNPDFNEASRRGIALEFLAEATDELRDFLTENDYLGNRLVSAVAGAIRGEIGRLVAYLDSGCPAELEEDLEVCRHASHRQGSPDDFPRLASDLIQRASATSGRKCRPAELVDDILRLFHYEIHEADLGLDCPAVTDFARQVVWLQPKLRGDERALRLARSVAAIHLDAFTEDLDGAEMRRREDLYARILLLPDDQVNDYIATLPDDASEIQMVKAVSKEFCVPKRVVELRLQELRHLRD